MYIPKLLRSINLLTLVGVLLVGLGVCLYVLPIAYQRAPLPIPRVMSDLGSEPINQVVCSVNSARMSALRNARLTSDIVNALPQRTGVILAVNDPQAFIVASNPWPDRVRFLELARQTRITIWPQDPFVVLQDDKKLNTLLVSHEFGRVKDRQMAIELAKFLDWPWRDCPLSFEGGDIVSDLDHVFIGAAAIRVNAISLDIPEISVVRMFEAELGKPVLVIGSALRQAGHIDMVMTPLGDKKILVADSAWGAKIAEQQLADTPDTVEAFEQNCENMFFGAAGITELKYRTGQVVERPDVVGETLHAIEHSKALAPHLDGLAKVLTGRGYEVFRIPFLFVRLEPAEISQEDVSSVGDGSTRDQPNVKQRDREQLELRYPELTYNNVLLETAGGSRIVYLPQYGWDAFDDEARRVWSGLVDEVKAVPGFAISAMYGGSLRCCTKVLSRG